MALGEQVVFDINRFFTQNDNAIAVTCETEHEVYSLLELLKRTPESNKVEFVYEDRIKTALQDMDEWVNIYCHEHEGKIICDIISDIDCDGEAYLTDYYYKDIIFAESIKVSKTDLFDFLKG